MAFIDCDILVVGAGPAGASAASAAAEAGKQVLMVERRNRIGIPVQCAEYIPAMLLGQIDIKRDFIAQKISGMLTILPDEPIRKMSAPGYIINRDLFDQSLAANSVAAGVKLMIGTSAVSIDESSVVTLQSTYKKIVYASPKIIIGADGPHSTVGQWAGLLNAHFLFAVQCTLPLNQMLEYTEVYFDPSFSGGYAWLFPKGKEANVGLGVSCSLSTPRKARHQLEKFVDRLKKEGKVKQNPKKYTAGWIPAVPVRNAVAGNIVLVGDAAGHSHPITGAGNFTAVSIGEMAGRWAAKAIEKNDLQLLHQYDMEWQDLFGETLQKGAEKRARMEAHWPEFKTIIKSSWVAYPEYYA